MIPIKRRHFLQLAGSTLGTIGLSQLGLEQHTTHYGQALAQYTRRKVALLVGIGDYQETPLYGPVNDVELQRQLLIHRFGFNTDDVHVLCDENASRSKILGAFHEYLYEPARAGDVIVFHFSGHGDRVRESDLMSDFLDRLNRNYIGEDHWNTTIAPHRSHRNDRHEVDDIMGHTLLLMRAALAQKTEHVTFVLDCCYAGGGKRGDVTMRSLNPESLLKIDGLSSSTGEASESEQQGIDLLNPNSSTNSRPLPLIADEEWYYQQQLLEQLGWDDDRFVAEVGSPKGQGFFVGASQPTQLAAEYDFNGFTAGVFTYLLTQYLWQSTSSLSETIPMVRRSSTKLDDHSQRPEYDPKPEAVPAVKETPIYHIEPVSQPAEALVLGPTETKSEGDSVNLWLGGLNPWSLEAFDKGAVFTLIDKTTGDKLGEVQQIDGTRQGLRTEGRWVRHRRGGQHRPVAGQLLQEKIRGVPTPIILRIGLDETLTTYERQVAMDRLGPWSEFEVVTVQSGQPAHVLLGRYTREIHKRLIAEQVPATVQQEVGSLGLFSPAQEPMLTGSFGTPGEPIEDAIERLRSRFTSLYLGRLLALMINHHTSKIDISVEVDHLGSPSGTTTRGGDRNAIIIPEQSERGIEQVAVGDTLSITIKNNGDEALHIGVVVIDAAGEIGVLFPPLGLNELSTDEPTIDQHQIDVISPWIPKTLKPVGAEPYGITELLIMASPQSLIRPLTKLQLSAPKVDRPHRRSAEVDSIAAMDDLFGVMDTRRGGEDASAIKEPQLFDVEEVAVLSLLFEIVPKKS